MLATSAKALGANVALCSTKLLSAQADIAAYFYNQGIRAFAWRGETRRGTKIDRLAEEQRRYRNSSLG